MRKRFLLSVVLPFFSLYTVAQQLPTSTPLATKTIFQEPMDTGSTSMRKAVLASAQLGLWAGSFYALNKAWYANYPRAPFHFYNDWLEWQQMDKAGHMWSAYSISEHTSNIWKWAGTDAKNAIWIGGISAVAYLSIVEVLDGYSDKWGFSPPDMAANVIGAGAYIAQELAWSSQRIRIKMSYHPVQYGAYQERANNLFGNGTVEKILKDYNGQTYWVSANINSFLPTSGWPSWLNVAVGYGAENMLGGYENRWTGPNNAPFTAYERPRLKRFHLSLDMDLTKLKTKNKVLATLFSMINVLKIPAPSIEINTAGNIRFHPLFY